ncbi:hypothetical protein INT45_002608 [Circinella minor]|uniref:C2H2-type domain-containing protein n=1 Tax=Circinella minor TaxID=1195481 RepID=A0A8H7VEF5_9FUNG|nr:hypothetical protein INT45_002608 [Circinella minor]
MIQCEFVNCKRRFKSNFALRQHERAAHKNEVLPPTAFSTQAPPPFRNSSTTPTIKTADEGNLQSSEHNYVNVDDYYDDKFTPVTQTNSVSQGLSSTQTDFCKKLESLKLITNNTEVLATKANYEPKSKLSLSETELDYAKIAIDSQMSKAVFRSSMITTTQKTLDKQHETGDHIIIKTKTLDNLFYHIDNQAGDFMVVKYWHDTKLRSEILMHGNNRVYQDISSGKWWQELEGKLPISAMVLGVILSSDATGVSGNTRFKSYPLYCKLANTPNYIRNKATSEMSRVLAFLPTLDCPQEEHLIIL